MASLSEEMSTHKMIVDQSTEWTIYIWSTLYPRPWFMGSDSWYVEAVQTSDPIWRIRKFVIDDSGITEMFYPNGDTSFKFAWDDRDSYTYL